MIKKINIKMDEVTVTNILLTGIKSRYQSIKMFKCVNNKTLVITIYPSITTNKVQIRNADNLPRKSL